MMQFYLSGYRPGDPSIDDPDPSVGQADGVACRTVEMFEAFDLADGLLSEAYWVNEVCFWRPDPDDPARIKRAGRIEDTEDGLSEFPHVLVNATGDSRRSCCRGRANSP